MVVDLLNDIEQNGKVGVDNIPDYATRTVLNFVLDTDLVSDTGTDKMRQLDLMLEHIPKMKTENKSVSKSVLNNKKN